MAYIQHELEVSMIGDEHGLCVKGGFTTPPGRSCVKLTNQYVWHSILPKSCL